MRSASSLRARLLASVFSVGVIAAPMAAAAADTEFNIAPQSLDTALADFSRQSMVPVLATPDITGAKHTSGVTGAVDPQTALGTLLQGTGLTYRREGDTFLIVRADQGPQGSGAAGGGAEVEALIVTAQKREEDIQDVPIAISAFTQEQLERSQVAGGPDLMTQVPNMTFTKTNFSSYSIQIRGIGTQAISATVDAAVAVAFNNSSMIRNRFFEQEFYDLQRVEVLRGPQGTLYGRNATAGVVNIISAKPTFDYEAKLSGDISNYGSTRLEGMLNLPMVDDMVALRIAGAWTKRDGYVSNQLTGRQIDGRDLWSTRASLRIEPSDRLSTNLIWEHFEEDDDRLRSGKQLCKKHTPLMIGDVLMPPGGEFGSGFAGSAESTYSQGCSPVSMYSEEAFQTPNGYALPYFGPLGQIGNPTRTGLDPYVSASQSRDLRVIESMLEPKYRASSDVLQIQSDFDLTPDLSISAEAFYGSDELSSFQDFNRFNTKPGVFDYNKAQPGTNLLAPDGVFCDPQLGCSDRLLLADLSTAKSQQYSFEFRLSSDFDSAFNFSLGANALRYDTEDKYYVFINALSLWSAQTGTAYGVPYAPGITNNYHCLDNRRPGDPSELHTVQGCVVMDPNPVDRLNDTGNNYFLSKNPYRLISYAAFGEAYLQLQPDLKLTAGLRWTGDRKSAPVVPSWLIAAPWRRGATSYGYPTVEVVSQDWSEPTGRLALDWKPALTFTDETLIYGSYAHGYKAGGMNPPPAVIALYTGGYGAALNESIVQPKTFDAEFIDAFEVGAKNTLLDGRLMLNLGAFHYDYENYQLSQIVNRSAVTQNYDATIWGLEVEANWRPLENLRVGFKGGYQRTKVADGERAIDLIDRTAGNPDWVVARPFPTVPSNCILPVWLVTYGDRINVPNGSGGNEGPCVFAYILGMDPVTRKPYEPNPTNFQTVEVNLDWTGYPGFDPSTAPNNGEGFFKELGGKELPNAPRLTTTITVDYTVPLPNDWMLTLHGDYYRQSEAWTRIFNFDPYDRLKEYTNVNLAAILTNEERGWSVMAYAKNVFDKDAITGAFLNSDDTGLTTNVFLLEPRLFGLRVTKQWAGGPDLGSLFGGEDRLGAGRLTVEIGGALNRVRARNEPFSPQFLDLFSPTIDPRPHQDGDLGWGDGREARVSYRPGDSTWILSASLRYGKSTLKEKFYAEERVGFLDILYGYQKYNYTLSPFSQREEHMIVDFDIGRDVGLGDRLASINSAVKVGLRYAELQSEGSADIGGIPNYVVPTGPFQLRPLSHTQFMTRIEADRTFSGFGPTVAWEGSYPLGEEAAVGLLTVDAGLNMGVLFGRQKSQLNTSGYSDEKYVSEAFTVEHVVTDLANSSRRSNSVTVPTIGANLGLSWEASRFKVSGGYRWERYFDVLDVGYDEHQDGDRTIDGPYFKIAVGFGG